MALVTATVLSPFLPPPARQSNFRECSKPTAFPLTVRKYRSSIVANTSGETNETSLSISKSVQNVLENPEDGLAYVGIGFGAIVALWASSNLLTAVDKLPILPNFLELVGIIYSSWFVYRYLIFKSPREEFFRAINKSLSDVISQ